MSVLHMTMGQRDRRPSYDYQLVGDKLRESYERDMGVGFVTSEHHIRTVKGANYFLENVKIASKYMDTFRKVFTVYSKPKLEYGAPV